VLVGLSEHDRLVALLAPYAGGDLLAASCQVQGDAGSQFGAAVVGDADLDGDGTVDVVVGAPAALVSGDELGAVFVYAGLDSAMVDGTAAVAGWYGEGVDGMFGAALAGAPDVDGDGCDEVAAAAPLGDWREVDDGVVQLLAGCSW
jgi:hypothetical protein